MIYVFGYNIIYLRGINLQKFKLIKILQIRFLKRSELNDSKYWKTRKDATLDVFIGRYNKKPDVIV